MGRLREFVRETSGVVFLGAGASLDSGLPLGDQAATGIIRECFRAAGLMRICRDLERHRTLRRILWPRFEVVLDFLEEHLPGAAGEILQTFNDVGISAVHQLLAAGLKGHWLWLATNFDDQIERALLLDGAYMRNVIIRHNDVAYEGGPVVLDNVYFVDCTFKHFQMTPSGRKLGTKLLAAASVTFEARNPVASGL